MILFIVEVAVIVLIFCADIYGWHVVHWRIVVLSKTPYLLVLGWISLRLRNKSWRSLGMSRPQNWPRAIGVGVAAGCAMELLELFGTQPILIRLFHQPPDFSALKELHNNAGMLAVALLLTWTLAAFGEELVWRGYLLNRFAELLQRVPGHWTISIGLTSLAFGLAHFDQGRTGMTENALDGALLCGLYLLSGRNLWVTILAHGVTDTVDSVLLFAGRYPLP